MLGKLDLEPYQRLAYLGALAGSLHPQGHDDADTSDHWYRYLPYERVHQHPQSQWYRQHSCQVWPGSRGSAGSLPVHAWVVMPQIRQEGGSITRSPLDVMELEMELVYLASPLDVLSTKIDVRLAQLGKRAQPSLPLCIKSRATYQWEPDHD